MIQASGAGSFENEPRQYRLGLIYVMVYPSEVIKEKACPLFEQSLAHGFAPPALEISSWCLAYTDTPLYRAALPTIETSMPIYEEYFPQPTVTLECKPEEPVGMAMQWRSSRDYQAEIHRLQGGSDRARRLEYYQKALDISDCYTVQRGIGARKYSSGILASMRAICFVTSFDSGSVAAGGDGQQSTQSSRSGRDRPEDVTLDCWSTSLVVSNPLNYLPIMNCDDRSGSPPFINTTGSVDPALSLLRSDIHCIFGNDSGHRRGCCEVHRQTG
jgi:hypothetical protein